jgi:hypothetical protein
MRKRVDWVSEAWRSAVVGIFNNERKLPSFRFARACWLNPCYYLGYANAVERSFGFRAFGQQVFHVMFVCRLSSESGAMQSIFVVTVWADAVFCCLSRTTGLSLANVFSNSANKRLT